jgi:hypothetical protein
MEIGNKNGSLLSRFAVREKVPDIRYNRLQVFAKQVVGFSECSDGRLGDSSLGIVPVFVQAPIIVDIEIHVDAAIQWAKFVD